jgi:hypothetical protein
VKLPTGITTQTCPASHNTRANRWNYNPLRADGLPFVFHSFRLDSRVSPTDGAIDDGQPAVMQPGVTPRDETDVSPLSFDVMTYADR